MSIVVKKLHSLGIGQRDWEVRDFHGTEYKTAARQQLQQLPHPRRKKPC